MYSEVILKLDSVSKHYDLFNNQTEKISKLFRDFLNIKENPNIKKYEALNNISFEAKKGEVIGVLGRNGAGKSTLLQLVCGTLTPSKGSIHVNGRLAALLELGAGFNPEFSGRENIYINSAILGLSRNEIAERFDTIVEFADIGDFLDQPVKNYSSGMFMRLAFAVASSVEPDLLIIDEALAVGDARFQAKCFRRLDELRERGTTILLVTHSTEQITRHCSKALLIDQGKMIAFGDAGIVSNQYLELLFGTSKKNISIDNSEACNIEGVVTRLEESVYYNPHEHKWGNGEAEFINFNIRQGNELNPVAIFSDSTYEISFSAKFNASIKNVILGLTIKTNDGITIFGRNTREEPNMDVLKSVNEGEVVNATFFIRPQLCTGDYLISLGIVKDVDGDIIPMERRYDSICIRVNSISPSYGIVDLHEKIEVSNGNI
ncbi:ABC transporter ATP-binding protein [Vibrio diazotrophicus]|uniref:ABC transporter ATP-binding protein n=1 Tax=Vibrio diazotrophicus TaxID=685 RepID=UPI000C9DF6F6|nr:ABC transporter ATP-binding protein [Vibrio diazotrophicus]PNH97373.1 sugar ABC transporter ATP-binding protein [Vibrio diazotrophicus]